MKVTDDVVGGLGHHPLHHHAHHGSPSGGLITKRASSRKRLCIGVAIVIVVGLVVIGVCVGAYMQLQTRKREIRDLHVYMRALVDQVNQSPTSRWKAKFNPFGMRAGQSADYKTLKNLTAVRESVDHLEDMFKSEMMIRHLAELESMAAGELPRRFDAREKWPLCASLHHVPNQGGCGSCYAVASIGVASDRLCIHSNATFRGLLSAEDVIGCCQVCGSCYGGDPLKALVYWTREGVVDESCRPYSQSAECGTPCLPDEFPHGEARRTCQRSCQPTYYKGNYAEGKHKGSIAYTLFPRKMSMDQAGNERRVMPSIIGHFNKTAIKPLTTDQIHTIIQKELYRYGPTTMAIPLTEEFLHYAEGVFHPVPEQNFEKRQIYWHVVRLIGWGRDASDRLHWLAINSFGSQWGDNGLFKIDTSLLERFGLEYETGLP